MTLPDDVLPESLSRFPLVRREEMDEEGRRYYDAVVSDTKTLVGLRGPGGIWLHAPKLGGHVRAANQYLRFEAALGRRLTELAILVTAREIDSQFEWTAHEPAALKEGLEQSIIDVVKYGKPPGESEGGVSPLRILEGMGEREAVIIAFGREIFREKKVRSETFARAVELFGRQGVLELAALIGNYVATAIIFRTVDQQLRPDQQPLLPTD